jgi:hypothetical protein
MDYPLTADPIDAVITCSERDRQYIDLCVQGIRANVKNIRRIIVVSAAPYTNEAEWFDPKKYPFTDTAILEEIFKFNSDRLASRRYRYLPRNQFESIYQQLLQLYSHLAIPNLSSNVLAIDARTIYINPVEWMAENGEPVMHPDPADPNYAFLARVLPDLLSTHGFKNEHLSTPLLQRPVVEDLLGILAEFHQIDSWRGICRSLSSSYLFGKPPLSSSELYHRFMMLRTDQGVSKPIEGVEIQTHQDINKYKQQGLTYIHYKY